MFLFHKFSWSKTCNNSGIVQLIVHNDDLPNYNRCIDNFSNAILRFIDNIYSFSIFVSSPQLAMQQSGFLSNSDNKLNMWNLWSYHVHVFILPDFCYCNHD